MEKEGGGDGMEGIRCGGDEGRGINPQSLISLFITEEDLWMFIEIYGFVCVSRRLTDSPHYPILTQIRGSYTYALLVTLCH